MRRAPIASGSAKPRVLPQLDEHPAKPTTVAKDGTSPVSNANAPAHSPAAAGHRAAVTASFLGWTLDAFDFFLVPFALTAIAKEFGKPVKAIALSITITLLFRPLGAIIFGLMADRYGRRIPLMIDLVFFSIIEVATGFAHNFTTFLVLRALFGIGMGGEWGVGASLAMEKAPSNRRGIFSGLLQEGYACGNLLAAVCFLFVYPVWGWRPMFFIGGLPALLAIYVRFQVKESEVWERRVRHTWAQYGREIASHWKIFLYLVVLLTMMNFVAHGTQDMYPTFLERDWGFSPQRRALVTMFANVGAIIGGIIFGHYSDKIGRRKAIVLALVLAMFSIPLWAYAPSLPLLMAGAFVMQFMVQGAWGVIPVHINELAPDSVRGFLPGFAYQCGVMFASGVAYIEAVFAERTTYANAMALTAITVFVFAAIAAWVGRERHGVIFGES
ncbi:MAG TPA: MFS transporter [Gemmatimonadaceae bacterium]|nr:MFS transporter [Gemmatimonadaceae bacterium]